MKIRIFSLPTLHPDLATGELNAFLSMQRIIHVERQFVSEGANSFWSICVSYLDGATRTAPDKNEKIDYREVLPEAQFQLFARLRTLRKEVSEKEGLPAYALFTNEQLTEMVRQEAKTLTALKRIKGIGSARVEKYAGLFLPVLLEHFGQAPTNSIEHSNAEQQNLPR